MSAIIGGATIAPAIAAAQAPVSRAIPASPLSDALSAFSSRTGIRLSYNPATIAGRRSPGAQLGGDPAETLARLLAGTGLRARRIGAGSYAIEPELSVASGPEQIGTVRVEDTGDNQSTTSDPAASEGTGSYAARATTIFKGLQTPRETPLTLSTLTRQRLDDQNLFDLNNALAQVPGLTVTRSSGEDVSVISRGYSVNTEVDGVPFSFGERGSGSVANRFDTAIYDRVEALRGPAGVLQGVGSIGGTINLVRKRPSKELSVTGQLSIGSWNDFHGVMDVGGPISQSGSVRARFVGAYEDQDEFYDFVNSKHLTAYGVVEFDLGPHTVLGLTADHTYLKRRGQYFGIPEALTRQVKRSTYPGVKWSGAELSASELGADITHDFGGDWTATARYIHRTSEFDYTYLAPLVVFPDDDGVVRPTSSALFLVYEPQGTDRSDGIDASVSGPVHALGGTHQLTFGVDYARARSASGSPNTIAFGQAIAPDIEPVALDPNTDQSYDHLSQYAPFGQAKIALLKGLSLIAGGRYTHYRSDTRNSGTNGFIPYGRSNGHFTPYAGVVWDATKHVSLYASYADIFQPQTIQDFAGNILPPTIGWQGEAGIKTSFFGDRLTGTIAYYRIRERNRAFPDPDPSHVDCGYDGATCYLPLGKVQSQGIDAEISGSPISGLQLQASYTYNRNKFLVDAYQLAGSAFESSTPKHQFKLWSIYQFGKMKRVDVGRFSVGGGMIAQSRIYFDDKAYGQKAYAVFDAQVGYRPTENSQLTLSVNNVFDANYLDSVGPFNFFGTPRSLLLSLRFGR